MQTHFKDPCIHCGKAIEDFEVGACQGDPAKAVVIAYRSLGVRWDGYETFLVRLSTNEVRQQVHHISVQAPYRGFSMLGDIQTPPRHDETLRL